MSKPEELMQTLSEALALLQEHAGRPDPQAYAPAPPLPSLLEQCASMVAARPGPQPYRVLHHMACTGGTLISRCLATMPNVVLLSEIDPLSAIPLPKRGQIPRFEPSDLIYAARVGPRRVGQETILRMFRAALTELQAALEEQGQSLCLRDHAHSQFCTHEDPASRPNLNEILQGLGAPVRAAVTVRHPLDSFLSLQRNAWLHFTPETLEEYARRYLLFLDCHAGIEILRYEDFVTDPETGLQRLCDLLELPYVPGAESLLSVVALSGDSGRRGRRIAPRERRPVPEDLAQEAAQSKQMRVLCARLGYEM
jgi:hypothetical protein